MKFRAFPELRFYDQQQIVSSSVDLGFQPDIWLSAEVLLGNDVSIWQDPISGYHFSGTSGILATKVNPDARLAGGVGYRFTGSDGYFPQNSDKERWRFLTNGIGFGAAFIFNYDTGGNVQTLMDQINSTTNPNTVGHNLNITNQNVDWFLARGETGVPAFQLTTAGATFNSGSTHVIVINYSETADPNAELWIDGVIAVSGNTTTAPSAGDATNLPFIARRVNSIAPMWGDIASDGIMFRISGTFSPTEIGQIQTFARTKYGAP